MTIFDTNAKMLDRTEAAEYLGVKPLTLLQWAHKKKHIPYYKIGRLAKYKLSDLQEFVNKSKQQVTCNSANG
jgi:excisionase family DNA binding protein